MKQRAQTGAAYSTAAINGSENCNASGHAKISCRNPYLTPLPTSLRVTSPRRVEGLSTAAEEGYDRQSATRQIGLSGSRRQPEDARNRCMPRMPWGQPRRSSPSGIATVIARSSTDFRWVRRRATEIRRRDLHLGPSGHQTKLARASTSSQSLERRRVPEVARDFASSSAVRPGTVITCTEGRDRLRALGAAPGLSPTRPAPRTEHGLRAAQDVLGRTRRGSCDGSPRVVRRLAAVRAAARRARAMRASRTDRLRQTGSRGALIGARWPSVIFSAVNIAARNHWCAAWPNRPTTRLAAARCDEHPSARSATSIRSPRCARRSLCSTALRSRGSTALRSRGPLLLAARYADRKRRSAMTRGSRLPGTTRRARRARKARAPVWTRMSRSAELSCGRGHCQLADLQLALSAEPDVCVKFGRTSYRAVFASLVRKPDTGRVNRSNRIEPMAPRAPTAPTAPMARASSTDGIDCTDAQMLGIAAARSIVRRWR
jgi:hypothetical protein